MRMKEIEKKHKKEIDELKKYIKSLENINDLQYNNTIKLNRKIDQLSLEHTYNLNNIDIIVRQSKYPMFNNVNRISVQVQEDDKYICYTQMINNNIFEIINIDRGAFITDVIANIVKKIFKERGLI